MNAPREGPVAATRRAQFFPALLFFSGYCGISYEVLYARFLGNMVGDQFAVVASVLLTFLLGIGLGTLVAHVLWRFLWAIEAAVGLYAILLTLGQGAIDRYLYRGVSGFGVGLADSMAFAVTVLAVPAFLIGCSLPLFAGYLRALQPQQTFSRAYTLYNLGAAATALLIEFFLPAPPPWAAPHDPDGRRPQRDRGRCAADRLRPRPARSAAFIGTRAFSAAHAERAGARQRGVGRVPAPGPEAHRVRRGAVSRDLRHRPGRRAPGARPSARRSLPGGASRSLSSCCSPRSACCFSSL